MSASRKKQHRPSENDAPLVGLQPVDPPRRNPAALAISSTLLLGWLGVLIWLAIQSRA